MNSEQARAFLQALGGKKPEVLGKWVRSSCPLAPILHQNHKDTNPSFGLTHELDKPSRYNCFACGHGSALELVQAMEFYGLQVNFKLARQILDNEKLEVVPLPEYGEFNHPEDMWVFQPWPEGALQLLPAIAHLGGPPIAISYLHGRGVTDEQIKVFDLRWDADRQMIVFPIREAYGQLAGARGRSVNDESKGPDKHHDYSHKGVPKNIKGVWFNEPVLHLPGPVVVVEGQFDVLRVAQVWPKVVGNLTAMPTADKLIKLATCERVIHIPDNDKTGLQSVAKFKEGLSKYGSTYSLLALPETVKDPGACHVGYLKDLIERHVEDLC